MKKLERLKEHMVFLTSVLVAVSIIIYGYICSNTLNFVSGKVMRFVSDQFGWLYIAFVFFPLLFYGMACVWEIWETPVRRRRGKTRIHEFYLVRDAFLWGNRNRSGVLEYRGTIVSLCCSTWRDCGRYY